MKTAIHIPQRMQTMRLMALLLMALGSTTAQAQRRMVVVDVETRVPIEKVSVVGAGATTTTDSLGFFSVADSCRSLAFSHVNYEPRLINIEEVGDTVFLISKWLNVREVVVFGMMKDNKELRELQRRLKLDKTEAQLLAAKPGGGNLLGLLTYLIPKKWVNTKSKKERRRERLKQVLDNY